MKPSAWQRDSESSLEQCLIAIGKPANVLFDLSLSQSTLFPFFSNGQSAKWIKFPAGPWIGKWRRYESLFVYFYGLGKTNDVLVYLLVLFPIMFEAAHQIRNLLLLTFLIYKSLKLWLSQIKQNLKNKNFSYN